MNIDTDRLREALDALTCGHQGSPQGCRWYPPCPACVAWHYLAPAAIDLAREVLALRDQLRAAERALDAVREVGAEPGAPVAAARRLLPVLLADTCYTGDASPTPRRVDLLAHALASMAGDGRRAGLEEAARVCADVYARGTDRRDGPAIQRCEDAIRAILIPNPRPEREET